MYKGYKIRIYPTKEQETAIKKHIGACRFIWNYFLRIQIDRYKNSEKHLSNYETMKILTQIKKEEEYAWLNDISCTSLQRVCTSLSDSYIRMFKKHANLPKFKSKKKAKLCYPVRSERIYFTEDNCVQIEKVGHIKYKSDFIFPTNCKNKFLNAHISIVEDKYMLSFDMDCENQAIQLTENLMGIDLGIKELAVVANGNNKMIFHNINKSKKVRALEKKLKHEQKIISRKYESSKSRTGAYRKTKNIEREEKKVRKIYARLTGIRHNYLHQTSHKLISLAPKRITMESISVLDMMKNKHLSKAIQDQCFYEFIRQMKYKCEWNGVEFIQVPRFYPSSKTCSCCGNIKQNLKLTDRTYICQSCGCVIDRDYNAAINLMRYADLNS